MENQLEILVGMFPELEKAMPPPAPRTNPAPQEPTPQEPKSQVNPPKSISKEDIEERKLLCMKMVELYLALNHLTLILKSIY